MLLKPTGITEEWCVCRWTLNDAGGRGLLHTQTM